MRAVVKNVVGIVAGIGGVIGLVCLVLVMLGYRPFILVSPSMEPLYVKGSLVWADTRPTLDEIEIGDVLVYRAPSGNLVMHRLVGEGLLQGDANNVAQEVELDKTNYVGRAAFSLPWLGDAVAAVLTFRWVVFGVIGVLLVLACIPQRSPSVPPSTEDNKKCTAWNRERKCGWSR